MPQVSLDHSDCISVYEDGEFIGVAIRTEASCWIAVVPNCKNQIFNSRFEALHSIHDAVCSDWFDGEE